MHQEILLHGRVHVDLRRVASALCQAAAAAA
ncbi:MULTISPECIES: putative leader peptide [unclassified Streptomyces]